MKQQQEAEAPPRPRAFDGLSNTVCPVCLKMAWAGKIRPGMVMPLPDFSPPLLRSDNKPCCRDCAAADGLAAGDRLGMNFDMARIAVGNEREEHMRMPLGMSEHFGLVKYGYVLPCSLEDLKWHQDWLFEHRILTEAV